MVELQPGKRKGRFRRLKIVVISIRRRSQGKRSLEGGLDSGGERKNSETINRDRSRTRVVDYTRQEQKSKTEGEKRGIKGRRE